MIMFGMEWFCSSIITTSLIGLSCMLLIYWYSTRNHDYWAKRGIPYARPLPFIGSLHEVLLKPMQDVDIKRSNLFGSVYGHFEGNRPILSVADPFLLKDILVKDFPAFSGRRVFKLGTELLDKNLSAVRGEDWKRIRTIVTPTFTTGKIKRMLGIFKDCAETLGTNFKTAAQKGKPVDTKSVYGAFTMDVIASSAFSTKIDSHNDPNNEFVSMAKQIFFNGLTWKFLVLLVAPRLVKMLKISVFPMKVLDFFANVTHQIMEERQRTGQGRNDFLQLLMETAKEVKEEQKWDLPENERSDIASNYGQEDINPQIFKNVTSKHLSTNELVAQCLIFFLAGYDTTSSALSFATYSLALNPDIQDKLRKEVDEALEETNGYMTYESVQNMKYLDNVISETLRMFPPAVRLERVADVAYKLGKTGIIIPKDMLVSIPIMAMHMDPELFPNPETFDPDRFTSEERAKRPQYAYLPFGAGPRNCVAMRFALLEIKVCLAHVISNFIIKRSPHTKVPIEFDKSPGLLKPKEILVEIELRKEHPIGQ